MGHVSITAVSTALTKRIEVAAADDEAEDDSADDDIDLKDLFEIGQYLRAYVVSTTEDSTGPSKAKRRIELSIRPEDANSTLSKQELVANATLMASVASVEDHGYVMDIGLSDSKITGFLPKKEVDAGISGDRLQPGNVFLCIATGLSTNRKVVQLSTKSDKVGNIKNFPAEATTINTFVPGTAVEVLLNEISEHGLTGKVLGDLDVTADLIHSGIGPNGTDLAAKYKVPSKVKARVICTFPEAKTPKLGVSILDHVKSLKTVHAHVDDEEKEPVDALPISSTIEQCEVLRVEADIGLFVDVGVEGVPGFVHISRVKDGKVDGLYETSGPFKVGSKHKGRVVGYNAFDGLYLLSFEKTVLEQPFLRIEDVPVGNVVNGVVEKLLIGENGVSGLIVKLAEGISGLVPETHLSDVRLQHPEKKFREGSKVKARVLSTDPSKRQIRLTLKKTLVNSEEPAIKSYDEVSTGMQVVGTIISVMQNGAIVQFYGSLRGLLPLSEMSEAYISDPKEHFRKGQVVNVHVIDVNAEANRLIVSCKDPAAFGMDKQLALKKLSVGKLVSGKVSQKTEDDVFVELEGSLLKAILTLGHLTDKSPAKNQTALKRIRVGTTLSDLAVLEKNEGRRSLTVTMKPSMVAAAKEGKLFSTWEKAKAGQLLHGFVRNITPTAVFVQFGGNLTALLPVAMMPQEQQKERDFGLQKLQSISVKVISVDKEHSRVLVAIPSVADAKEDKKQPPKASSNDLAENPVDETIKSEDDISVGKITKAKIMSIKSTQLNVRLADNIQGRVDVSQVFDSWDDIRHPKNPLQKFKQNSTIKVKVLGVHDARNHRFLPLSHRSTHRLIELSAKPSDLKEEGEVEMLSLDKVKAGSDWVGFVNNVKANSLWINLSPTVRGRMAVTDASNDMALLTNPSASFPIGSAVKVKVKVVDAAKAHLDLTATSSNSSSNTTWETIKKGLVLPAKVTKVTERLLMVQLSDNLSGPVHLCDLEDDYDEANPKKYTRGEIIRVAVVDIDIPNKKLRLSTRPSRVLSSNLPVKDAEVTTISGFKTGDIVRGYVKNVADKGLFVTLGGHVTALVRISDLSDSFLKEWKPQFQVDQLVKGRITAIDMAAGQVTLSLKASIVEGNYTAPKTIADFTEGQVVTGKVRKVEDFGAFIVIDGTANVSGLCHRSEMAEKTVKDARKLYNEGDVVKARIMKIDLEKKTINFGLKPSYFEDEDSDEDMDNSDNAGAPLDSDEDEEDSDDDREFVDAQEVVIRGTDNRDDSSDDDEDDEMADGPEAGLDAGGFDWSGGALDDTAEVSDAESDADVTKEKKKTRRKKAEIQVDRTAQMDANGPQSATDFERLLMGQPDSSDLWMQYMAFQLQVSEPAKAREIAERALKTINIREEAEKLNVWTAYMNLENGFGTDETLEQVFKRACQYNDEQVVHERLTTIYIKTGKHDVSVPPSPIHWIVD